MIAVFDTCIVLDYLLDRSPFADDAEELILQVADGMTDGLITVKSLNSSEFFSIALSGPPHSFRRRLCHI